MESAVLSATQTGVSDGDREHLELLTFPSHLLSREGLMLWANRAELEFLGYAAGEYLGHPVAEFHADRARAAEMLRILAEDGKLRGFEARLRHRDGGFRDVILHADACVGADGTPCHRCFAVDITASRRREDELLARDALLGVILEKTPVMAARIDSEGVFRESFGAGLRGVGLADGQAVGLKALELWPESRSHLERALAGEPVHWRFETGEGESFRCYEVWYVPDTRRKGEIIGFGIDITDRKRAEEELDRSEALNRRIIESSRDCIQILDGGGRLLSTSRVGRQLLEVDEPDILEGISWLDLWRGSDRLKAEAALAAALREGSGKFQGICPTFRGKPKWWDVLVTPILDAGGGVPRFLAVSRDITEHRTVQDALRRSEDQLRQSQKMEAVGRLAGGVAHDFNNLLTAISGYSELLLHSMEDGDLQRETVLEIRKAGERAAALTRQLLTFSRKRAAVPRSFDLNHAVADMRQMLARLIGEDIELATSGSPDLHKVRADPAQVEQVILNLAVNARDAMPRGGRLSIEVANEVLDGGEAGFYFPATPGDYVRLTVRDTGVGMDDDVKVHLFEPFFTTKASGHGTGLGLSMVYGIVQQAGGNLAVWSEKGKGTAISAWLPADLETRDEQPAPGRQAAPARSRAGETILLVEDEDVVRRLAAQVLGSQGYRVVEASSGPEALAKAEALGGPIDLLLTDVVMSGMSGRELAEQLVARRPGLRVLYMSGYTEDAVLRHGVFQNRVAFLGKPFSPPALIHKLREVLEGDPHGAAAVSAAASVAAASAPAAYIVSGPAGKSFPAASGAPAATRPLQRGS